MFVVQFQQRSIVGTLNKNGKEKTHNLFTFLQSRRKIIITDHLFQKKKG